MERTCLGKNFFDYAAYTELIQTVAEKAAGRDEDAIFDCSVIEKAISDFCNYVSVVDSTETQIKIACIRLTGDDMRSAIQNYDGMRRKVHEAAIAKANMINKIAELYGTEKIFLGDISDRYQVADFCMEIAEKIFRERKL